MSLTGRSCAPCAPGTPAMAPEQAQALLAEVPGWTLDGASLVRNFTFRNYYQTVAFVNAVAWVAHREDHHPDISFGYKTCRIRYSTHAVGGLSENDFICAARINLLAPAD